MLPVLQNIDNNTKDITELKGIVSGLLFQTATNTKESSTHLGIIKLQTKGIMAKMEAADAEKVQEEEDVQAEEVMEDVDGDGENKAMTDLLIKIEENTRETADAMKVVADAAKEQGENVPTQDAATNLLGGADATGEGGGDENVGTSKSGLSSKGFAGVLGALVGAMAGIVKGFLGAFRLVFNKLLIGPLKKIFPKTIGRIGNAFKSIATKIRKFFQMIFKPFKMIGDLLKNIVGRAGQLGGIFSKIGGFFKTFMTVARSVMSIVSKVFLPLTIIFAIFETIKGFFDGFINSEGSIVDKIIGGLVGAMEGLFDFFISMPLDLIKNLISWIAGMLGFDGIKEKLDSFSFDELFGGMFDGIQNLMTGIKDFFFNILGKIGIPSFTIPLPKLFGGPKTFPGFFPFKKLAAAEQAASKGDAGGEPESPTVKVEEMDEPGDFGDLKEIEVPGRGRVLIGQSENGDFQVTDQEGESFNIKSGSQFHGMIDKLYNGGAPVGEGSGSGGQIDAGTAEALAAAEEAAASGGAGSMTVINAPSGGSTSTSHTTNKYGSSGESSLKSRSSGSTY